MKRYASEFDGYGTVTEGRGRGPDSSIPKMMHMHHEVTFLHL